MAIRKNVNNQTIFFNDNNDFSNMEAINDKLMNSSQIPEINYQDYNVESMNFDTEHVVKSGETLSSIAREYGLTNEQ